MKWAAAILPLLAVLATGLGAVSLSPGEVVQALVGTPAEPMHGAVVWTLRLPRVLLAVLVGGGLGLSGALTQGLFRNPLADPGLIGVTAGAALAVAAVTVALPAGPVVQGFAAFLGALGVVAAVVRAGRVGGEVRLGVLLLAGVAVNAIAAAGIGLLLWVADDAALRSFTFWTMGSLGGATWERVGLAAVGVGVPSVLALRLHRRLDASLLGEEAAAHLGVPVTALRREVVAWVALAVGVCVALTGTIGFVGLVVPHAVRLLSGPAHKVVLPGACVGGAILLLGADTVARTVAAPAELPVGLLTTLLGGPVFLALLRRHRGAL